jgi:SAM-dependent methyltransferase
MSTTRSSPFDALARDYDAGFSQRGIGRLMREAVWHHVDATFAAGHRVLDLGCGTGEDAVHVARRGVRVVALDASATMVRVAREKVLAAGLSDAIDVRECTIEAWMREVSARTGAAPGFDGALANFGVLNCVNDVDAVVAALAHEVRPGGWIWMTVMGPWVPWEWGWWLAHGRPARAFRRLQPGGSTWRGLRVTYPSVGRVVSACAPHFHVHRVAPVGALVPPPYTETWAARHPRLLGALARWEWRLQHVPALAHVADHFLIGAERVTP